ncbi:MAG TPA: galactokinase, partial [Planctomycetota bacterium]|nr:galactokinase [Planctomycetota bacterium]
TLSACSFSPVRMEQLLPMPAGMVFAVAFSGITAAKTGAAMGKFNRASRLASTVADQWRKATGRSDPHMGAALAAFPDSEARLRSALSGARTPDFSGADLLRRAEQFIAENQQIIPAAARALAAGDLESFGRQVDRSQQLAESHLENQVPETIFLARSARSLGAAAASAFGAGFGGSVWAMVREDRAEQFAHEWTELYRREFPPAAGMAVFFLTGAAPGACFLY